MISNKKKNYSHDLNKCTLDHPNEEDQFQFRPSSPQNDLFKWKR